MKMNILMWTKGKKIENKSYQEPQSNEVTYGSSEQNEFTIPASSKESSLKEDISLGSETSTDNISVHSVRNNFDNMQETSTEIISINDECKSELYIESVNKASTCNGSEIIKLEISSSSGINSGIIEDTVNEANSLGSTMKISYFKKNNDGNSANDLSNISTPHSPRNGLDSTDIINSTSTELKEHHSGEAACNDHDQDKYSLHSFDSDETKCTTAPELQNSESIFIDTTSKIVEENNFVSESTEYSEPPLTKENTTVIETSGLQCDEMAFVKDKSSCYSKSNGDDFSDSHNLHITSNSKNDASDENPKQANKDINFEERQEEGKLNPTLNSKIDIDTQLSKELQGEKVEQLSSKDQEDTEEKKRKTSEEHAIEEKTRLEKFINMVQEKIQAEKKKREQAKNKDENSLV